MLTAFTRAFRTPDLRKKLLFTLFIIAVFRLGSVLPTPGVNTGAITAVSMWRPSGANGNIYGMVNLFSGGALLKLSVFALGIMPYITASIILQLLTVVIPRLEALKKEGQAGTTKITQYTRYLTIGLAILQGPAFVAHGAHRAAVPAGLRRGPPLEQGLVHHRHDGRRDDRRHRRSSCGWVS